MQFFFPMKRMTKPSNDDNCLLFSPLFSLSLWATHSKLSLRAKESSSLGVLGMGDAILNVMGLSWLRLRLRHWLFITILMEPGLTLSGFCLLLVNAAPPPHQKKKPIEVVKTKTENTKKLSLTLLSF